MATLGIKYWEAEFSVSVADLDRICERIRRDKKTVDITTIAKHLVNGRIEYGYEESPSVLKSWTGKESVRLWDPAGKWAIGDGVIVAKIIDLERDEYGCFVGEVIGFEKGITQGTVREHVCVQLDGWPNPVTYSKAAAGSPDALRWHEMVHEVVEQKYESKDIQKQVDGIILKYGNKIVSALRNAMESDKRFVSLEGNWYLDEILPQVPPEQIDQIHEKLVAGNSEPESRDIDIKEKMAIHVAMAANPKKFINTGTKSRPKWEPAVPTPEEAIVNQYAFDPETYMIICQPGKQLNQRQVQRLNELKIYSQVVKFAE